MNKYLKCFLDAIYAGICIAISGIVFLSSESKIAGALLFSLGLFTILVFKFNLFTGKVGLLPEKGFDYYKDLILIWFGNLFGTYIVASIIKLTRIYITIESPCRMLVQTKLQDTAISLIVLGILCGIIMYIAVTTFNTGTHPVIKSLITVFCITVFILSGFEHSIADMFYFSLSSNIKESILPLIYITIGNSIGGNLIPVYLKYRDKTEQYG